MNQFNHSTQPKAGASSGKEFLLGCGLFTLFFFLLGGTGLGALIAFPVLGPYFTIILGIIIFLALGGAIVYGLIQQKEGFFHFGIVVGSIAVPAICGILFVLGIIALILSICASGGKGWS